MSAGTATVCLDRVYQGPMAHSRGAGDIEIIDDAVLGVGTDGKILFFGQAANLPDYLDTHGPDFSAVTHLPSMQIMIPGFIDTHCHAPQYPNAGIGLDLPLLGWLQKYTFPTEARFADLEFARKMYPDVVSRTLRNGTTTCCYFATTHLEACLALADIARTAGQRALIGKVCMDRNSPDFYIETTRESVEGTVALIEKLRASGDAHPLVTPIVTPRFVPTCSEALMAELGQIVKNYDVPVQTHLDENKEEVAWVASLHPNDANYAAVYDRFGLLTNRTVLAHGVHITDDECALIRERQSGIAHCPNSNFSLGSGVCNVRRLQKAQVKVSLGTDMSGGYHPSILDAARNALVASTVVHMLDAQWQRFEFRDLFHLGTLGGAEVLGMDSTIGNFVPGKFLDALIVDPLADDSPFDVYDSQELADVLQKFMFLGDDRNVDTVIVAGKVVHRSRSSLARQALAAKCGLSE